MNKILKSKPDMNENITTDTFFNGRVKVNQTSRGYRFSIDAVLLAAAAGPKPGDVVMDIGTGCGIVSILLAFQHPDVRLFGIELQEELAKIAEKNVAINGMQDRITIINQDIRLLKHIKIEAPVDWVTSNPPYRPVNSGRINPNSQRALARHELHLKLKELIQAARRFLCTGGRFVVVYPNERLVDLFYEMRMAGLEPKWMRSIHSRYRDGAKLVLVQGRMSGRKGLEVAPPLVIYDSEGNYSEEVKQMLAPTHCS